MSAERTWQPVWDCDDWRRWLPGLHVAHVELRKRTGSSDEWAWTVERFDPDGNPRYWSAVAHGYTDTAEDAMATVDNWAGDFHRHAVVVDGREHGPAGLSRWRCRECGRTDAAVVSQLAYRYAAQHAANGMCESTWQARMRGDLDMPLPL